MKKCISVLLVAALLLGLIPVSAFAARPKVLITEYNTSIADVRPGSEFVLRLTVKNTGNEAAKNVLLTIVGSEEGVFVKGANIWFAANVAPGENKTANLAMASSLEAVSKTYYFQAYIQYEDALGNEYSESQEIAVFVSNGKIAKVSQSAVIISNYSVNPAVITPGKQFTLEIELENVSEVNVRNVSVSVAEMTGAVVNVATGNTKLISNLAPKSRAKTNFMMVSEGSGTSRALILEVLITYEDEKGTAYSSTQKIGLLHTAKKQVPGVAGAGAGALPSAQLTVSRYTVSPAQIHPGARFYVNLIVKNNGKQAVKDILISLGTVAQTNNVQGDNVQGDAGASSSDAAVVVGTGNTKFITDLGKGEEDEVGFELISNATLSPGVYNLPVRLDYADARGTARSSSQMIGLIVTRKPVLEFSSISYPRGVVKGEEFNFSAEIENRSDFSVKGVSIELKSKELKISNGKLFVGTLEQGDSDVLEASVVPQKIGTKEALLIIKYRDDFNIEQSIEKKIKIKVIPEPKEGRGKAVTTKEKGLFEKIISFFKALFGLGG